MDLFVFISGYLMGSTSGASIGILTWLIYGTLNPYGFNLPTLFATMLGESFYGIFGGIYARYTKNNNFDGSLIPLVSRKGWESNAKMGIIGFISTFIYDMFTNVVTSLIFEVPLVAYILVGIPFTAVHEISNFFFFFIASNVLIQAIRKIVAREVRYSDTEK
jgi:hypothetical protein